ENLTVGGSLDLQDCTGITALPENLTVGGSLDLRGTGITALPENLTVGGSIIFDLDHQLTNISAFRKNCGNHNRTIYAVLVGDAFKCHAGCFAGSLDEFCSRVEKEYSAEGAKKYIAQMQECVDEVISKI